MAFPNLTAELGRKRIGNKALAAAIGCSEKTLYNKMSGATEFTLSEILTISECFLPEFKIDYLFTKQDKSA